MAPRRSPNERPENRERQEALHVREKETKTTVGVNYIGSCPSDSRIELYAA